jgi:hypothetical protein
VIAASAARPAWDSPSATTTRRRTRSRSSFGKKYVRARSENVRARRDPPARGAPTRKRFLDLETKLAKAP